MEPLDIDHRTAPTLTRAETPPASVLLIGGAPELRVALVDRLAARGHEGTHVGRRDEALAALRTGRYDLVVVNTELPDGEGLDVLAAVQQRSVATKTIVFSETSTFALALRAMREGAIDYIQTPVPLDEFVQRVDSALAKGAVEKRREQRLRRLQRICRELHNAREEISDQVDSLCSDLLTAYQDLTEQINDVAMASEFRTLVRQELDIEDLLRTTLEYLLSKTGPTNAAVFLPDPSHHYSLGAYVNYDCPRESIDQLLDHLCGAICPQMADEHDIVAFPDAHEFAEWIGMEDSLLAGAEVIAFPCRHENECLAVIVLFRDHTKPFTDELAGTLDLLRTIFAEQLSRVIRVHHRAAPDWPADAADDEQDFDDYGFDLAA